MFLNAWAVKRADSIAGEEEPLYTFTTDRKHWIIENSDFVFSVDSENKQAGET